MNPPNPNDLNNAVEAGNKTIQSQVAIANKFPWAWTLVITLGMFCISWWINDKRYSSDSEKKDKRIIQLETEIKFRDSAYPARIDATRLYYDTKLQNALDENKQLWYRVGGIDYKNGKNGTN